MSKEIKATELPALGQPLGGGTFARRYWDGDNEYALIDLGSDAEFTGTWGEYGQDVKTGFISGEANTMAMAEAGSEIAKKAVALDAFIPSQLESALLKAAEVDGHIGGFDYRALYWTSSQYSADLAFSVDFEHGWIAGTGKSNERRVRPARRILIIQ